MPQPSELKALIEQNIPGSTATVVDFTGTGDHFEAHVVSTQFGGLSRIQQHKLVHAAVKERWDDGSIHALSIKTAIPKD